MKTLLYSIIAIAAVSIGACTKSQSEYNHDIDDAENVMQINVDSAMSMLDDIDLSELTIDSIKAKYIYLKAWGHMRQNRSMIGDSLISYAHNFYSGKDVCRDMRSGSALAWYKFWVGDMPRAISILDSLVNLDNIPDSLLRQALRIRVLLGVSEYQGSELIPSVKKLEMLESDSMRKIEAKYCRINSYEYAEEFDSALLLIDELIDYARTNNWGDKQFYFELEKAQILGELGLSVESDASVDAIFAKSSPDNGAADYLHMQYAINALNMGNIKRASHELALADSFAVGLRPDDTYYNCYSNLLHAMIDFKQNGKMKLSHVNGLNNRQRERYNRIKASQWESELGALQQQRRALALKAENEHKTVIILLISIVALFIIAAAVWIIIIRRHREHENEERIEALQKMVDEYNSTPETQDSQPVNSSALRSAMLKQLGIIKMVAETPTEQNREMLRKISSIDGETNGELVNWDGVFEIIDNLYSGFYSKLHDKYGEVVSKKEEQIITLMVAGFSTKEISVITGQTTSTIYVRKSSIRKKLGLAEKENIVRFLLK